MAVWAVPATMVGLSSSAREHTHTHTHMYVCIYKHRYTCAPVRQWARQKRPQTNAEEGGPGRWYVVLQLVPLSEQVDALPPYTAKACTTASMATHVMIRAKYPLVWPSLCIAIGACKNDSVGFSGQHFGGTANWAQRMSGPWAKRNGVGSTQRTGARRGTADASRSVRVGAH